MDTQKSMELDMLTQREQQVLQLVADGYSSKQIAQRLIISEHTVANHRRNMLAKTGARSSAELIFKFMGSMYPEKLAV